MVHLHLGYWSVHLHIFLKVRGLSREMGSFSSWINTPFIVRWLVSLSWHTGGSARRYTLARAYDLRDEFSLSRGRALSVRNEIRSTNVATSTIRALTSHGCDCFPQLGFFVSQNEVPEIPNSEAWSEISDREPSESITYLAQVQHLLPLLHWRKNERR